MDNVPEPITAMNDLDPEERERQENWRALQIALGLNPDEWAPPPAEPKSEPEPTREQRPAPRVERRRPEPEPETTSAFGAGLIELPEPSAESIVDQAPSSVERDDDSDGEVEVGEAPEEVPDEPSDEASVAEKKKRRRRRRRRKADDGEPVESGVNGEVGSDALPAASADPPLTDAEREEEEEDEEEEEEDDEIIEPLQIPDWNVPTWQELIASLYRPER